MDYKQMLMPTYCNVGDELKIDINIGGTWHGCLCRVIMLEFVATLSSEQSLRSHEGNRRHTTVHFDIIESENPDLLRRKGHIHAYMAPDESWPYKLKLSRLDTDVRYCSVDIDHLKPVGL